MLTLLFASCDPARRLAEDEYLLDKNYIEFKDSMRIAKEELNPVIKQSPNKQILGFIRFHLGVHNLANNGNDSSKVRRWLMEDVGEAPVVFDTTKTRRTLEQMQTYLTKKGYFRSKVRDSIVKEKERQRAEVYYMLWSGPLYRFGPISYDIGDAVKGNAKELIEEKSTLEEGQPFDIQDLDQERQQLADMLRDRGYYTFGKNSIQFKLDSSIGERKVAVELEVRPEVRNRGEGNDTVVTHPHQLWEIGRVIVNTDHDPVRQKKKVSSLDTLRKGEGYSFLYNKQLRIDPELLIQTIYIKPDHRYDMKKQELTYRRLSDLKVFRSVNISYERIQGKSGVLDCIIQLGRTKTHSLSFETRGTNRSGNLGISGNLAYQNRNIFRGGETFSVNLSGGVESQNDLTENQEDDNNAINALQLNTIQFGPELSLDFPKFLLPVAPTRFARSSDPTTRFSASMNFQQRPAYRRNVASVSMSYRWDETDLKKHRIDPIRLSMIRINKTRAFEQRLKEFDDQLLLNSYRDHLIFGSQYRYTYNSQERSEQENITFFRGNFEAAGNSLQAIHRWSGAQKGPEDRYRIADISYAQFIKAEADLRFYHRINSKSSLAFRLFGGIGVPYGNSDALPFQRSFFSGGANGLRAWRIRTIGPGSYTDSTFSLSFDKIGDIKLEGNVEYRFDLIDPFEGAFFLDAGNIWLLGENEKRPGGHFRNDDFLNDIAVGGGIGLRIDLNFLIVRLDLAVPLKDPQLPVGERWVFQPKEQINSARRRQAQKDPDRKFSSYKPRPNLNLGIGYPF